MMPAFGIVVVDEPGGRVFHELPAAAFAREIRRDGNDLRAVRGESVARLGEFFLTASTDGDVGAFLHQSFGDGKADTLAGSRNDGIFVFKSEIRAAHSPSVARALRIARR